MALRFQKILFTTDLSEVSWQALPTALDLARAFGSSLAVLSVIEEPYYLSRLGPDSAYAEILKETRPQVLLRIREQLDRHDFEGDVDIEILESEHPAKTIVEYARDHGVDLIVLATHGRSGLANLFIGSVAEKVVRMAPVPVLTIRAS